MGRNFTSAAAAEQRAREAVAAPGAGQQREAEEPDRDGVDVPVAGEGPQGERVPGVDQDPLGRQAGAARSSRSRQSIADGLEAQHRELHADHAVAVTCPTAAKISLRRRRVDRPRVIRAVDERVDRRVAQARQRRVGRRCSGRD